jgi:hypothetical protein
MIDILPKPTEKGVINEDDVVHYYCPNVYPNKDGTYIAFCGMDVTDSSDTEDDSNPCTMCMMDCNFDGPCPCCGSWDC